MNIKSLRDLKHLTQEELAIKSGISIRTIQRIEAGQEPKGYTAKALAKALDINVTSVNIIKAPREEINYSIVKLINLSSAIVSFIPLLNIVVLFTIMYVKREINTLTKQIVSLQILWTIIFILTFLLTSFLRLSLSLSHRLILWVMIILIIFNLALIIVNAASIDKNKKLRFKLNFSFI